MKKQASFKFWSEICSYITLKHISYMARLFKCTPLYIIIMLYCLPIWAQNTIKFTLPNEESPEVARIFRDLIGEFNTTYPNAITLDVQDSWDKGLQSFINNVRKNSSAGILLAKNAETLDLQSSGLVSNAETIMSSEAAFFDRFIPRYLANANVANKPYCAVPVYCTVPVVYYNMDKITPAVCNDRNFSPENLPQTYQELETLLLTLRGRSDRAPMLIGGDWYEWVFESMVLQNGGSLGNANYTVKFDSPEALATLKYWQKLWESELIDTAGSWKSTINHFKYQNYPIAIYSSGAVEELQKDAKFTWAATAMPSSKTKVVSYSGANLFFSSNMTAAQRQTAAQFTAFLYKKDISAQIAMATGLIAVTSGRMGAAGIGSSSGNRSALQQIQTAKPGFMTHQYDKMRKILKGAISRVFNGTVTADQSLARAQKEAMHVLNPEP